MEVVTLIRKKKLGIDKRFNTVLPWLLGHGRTFIMEVHDVVTLIWKKKVRIDKRQCSYHGNQVMAEQLL